MFYQGPVALRRRSPLACGHKSAVTRESIHAAVGRSSITIDDVVAGADRRSTQAEPWRLWCTTSCFQHQSRTEPTCLGLVLAAYRTARGSRGECPACARASRAVSSSSWSIKERSLRLVSSSSSSSTSSCNCSLTFMGFLESRRFVHCWMKTRVRHNSKGPIVVAARLHGAVPIVVSSDRCCAGALSRDKPKPCWLASELLATDETARKRTVETRADLTAQEAHQLP